jgi:hypothetical protein
LIYCLGKSDFIVPDGHRPFFDHNDIESIEPHLMLWLLDPGGHVHLKNICSQDLGVFFLLFSELLMA